ncbi:MAG: hypothetical protein JO256_03805 [Alphaproteobacteria bacterium]|nr:hypothetical protein [Alphaproteobacteria bacterium]
MASQTATHFSREQLAALSLVYRRVERIEAWNREESEAWALIHSMEGPGRRLDPPLQAELRKAINLASYLNGVINNSGVRMIRQVMDENLPFTPGERRDMAQAMKYQLPAWGCGKITLQPPPGYIQTVYGPGFQNEMDSLEKALPAFLALPKQ